MKNSDQNLNAAAKEKTFGESLWEKIKDKPIEMFALPRQVVSDYVTPVPIEPSKLFLTYKVSSVVSSLEQVLGKEYQVEMSEKYIIVSKKPF